jgi:hypothetical protein
MLTNWLASARNLEELKKLYHQLARQHHPDLGGNTLTMQEINAEYDLRHKFFLSDYAPKGVTATGPSSSRARGGTNSQKRKGKAKENNLAQTEWERLKISQEAYEAYQGVCQLREHEPYPWGLVVEVSRGKVRVRGKATYHYRNQLKALGFYWDSEQRYWYFVRKPRTKTSNGARKAS